MVLKAAMEAMGLADSLESRGKFARKKVALTQNSLYARCASARSTNAERVSLDRTVWGTGIRIVAAWAGPHLRSYDPPIRPTMSDPENAERDSLGLASRPRRPPRRRCFRHD